MLVPRAALRLAAAWTRATERIAAALKLPETELEAGKAQQLQIAVPEAVRDAGGQELHEFLQGRQVAGQSGCEACHRLGASGNDGPGPALTHVGSELTEAQIREALRDPQEPMPSFKDMPHGKLHALVRFLTLLK